jgi:hypothetical protein
MRRLIYQAAEFRRTAWLLFTALWVAGALFLLGWGYYAYLQLTFLLKHGGM